MIMMQTDKFDRYKLLPIGKMHRYIKVDKDVGLWTVGWSAEMMSK